MEPDYGLERNPYYGQGNLSRQIYTISGDFMDQW